MKTTRFLIPAAGLALVAACATSPKPPEGAQARATIEPKSGSRVTGWATFTDRSTGGVRVEAHIENAPPGVHGFHVHEKGDCSAPDASSAGGRDAARRAGGYATSRRGPRKHRSEGERDRTHGAGFRPLDRPAGAKFGRGNRRLSREGRRLEIAAERQCGRDARLRRRALKAHSGALRIGRAWQSSQVSASRTPLWRTSTAAWAWGTASPRV